MLGLLSFLAPRNVMIPVALIGAATLSLYIWNSNRTIQSLRTEIITLEVDKAQLTNAVNMQNATINYLENQARLVRQEFERAEAEVATTRINNEQLKNKLSELELDQQAVSAPIATEALINSTFNQLNRCFELVSGAPLNETEKAAKTAEQFNSECPWLFNNIIR
jgi:chromosome segregation ATPase